ncbi:MAG TPA: hypothetical protein VGP68_01030, partial [Gemmataceae bacterium]|nr:hypothetical protein [Gemmataceae bacterium]
MLFLLALVGHGLWVFVAAVFRLLTGGASRSLVLHPETEKLPRCTRCGKRLSSDEDHCPVCGLNRVGLLAVNLRDLKTTLRLLHALKEQGDLDAETFERVQQSVQARLDTLTSKPRPKPVEILPEVMPAQPLPKPVEVVQEVLPIAPPPEPVPVPQPALLQPQIEKFLEVCQDVRDLAADQTYRVAEWGRRVSEGENPLAGAVVPESAALHDSTSKPPVVSKAPPPEPPKPRRSLAEVFGAFMQESNIVWGELIAGLVMVGSSVALVISLWKTLEVVPYFPFLIFTAITVAVFGAGLYSLSHWKLESTSRGLLTIATLLVPLNFLVMAGLLVKRGVGEGGPDLWWRLASEAAALGAFAFLLGKAGRVLVADGRWWLTLAVLGISASALASPRLLNEDHTRLWRSLAAGLLPVACFVAGTGGMLLRLQRPADPGRAKSLLLFLGLATFPLILSLGFLVYWSQNIGLDLRAAFQRMSFLLAVAGTPLLTAGLLVQRVGGPAPERGLGTLRTAGTAVAFGGMAIMLAAVPLSWPGPWTTALVCGFNFVVLTIVAIRLDLPLAHVGALPCLVAGYLTAYHYFIGSLPADGGQELIALLLSQSTGLALVGLVLALAVTAELLVRTTYRIHGIYYAVAGSVLALASLAIVNSRGIGNPGHAAIVTGIYAIGGLAANLRWRRAIVDYLALALVPVATIWAMLWTWHSFTPSWGALLAVESLTLALIAATVRNRLLTPSAWKHTALGVVTVALLLTLSAPGMPASEITAGSLAILALTFLVLAWAYEEVALTWIGSGLLLGCFLQISNWETVRDQTPDAYAIAILIHASLVLLIGLVLRTFTVKNSWTERLYARSLPWIALASSLLAPVCLGYLFSGQFYHLACYTAWISAIWLGVAILMESALLFAAFQAALSSSVLLAVTSWLQTRPWVERLPDDLLDPRSLQAYGIGLAGLGLVWLSTRFVCRQYQRAQKLLEPAVPAFDWALLGVLVLGQFALAAWAVLPGILQEVGFTPLTTNWPPSYALAFGSGAWLLLGLLAVNLFVALRERERLAALYGLVLLAVTVPILLAGPFAADRAEIAALCLGLSLCYLTVSLLLWMRGALGRLPIIARVDKDFDHHVSASVRWMLLALTVLPALVITALVTLVSLAEPRLEPVAGTFFAKLGPVLAIVVPLILICVGLVGHALRECSPGYAFSAGLVVNFAVVTGYLLALVKGGNSIGVVESVRLLQLVSITAAIWALIVLASRPWITAWREGDDRPMARGLFSLQVLQPVVGNAILLFNGIALLISMFPEQASWSVEVGSPLGWTALVLALAAVIWRAVLQHRLPIPDSFGLVGLTLVGLAACSMLRWQPAWAYRTLMLGWALYMPALVGAAWLWSRRPANLGILGPVLAPPIVAMWVRLTCVAVVLLGIHAAVAFHDHLWGAASIAFAGTAGAAMAVWRRREDWAFVAGLAVNLAASLVVWDFRWDVPFETWWLYLVQANIVSAAVVALLWLGARKLLYGDSNLSLRSAPLLAMQIALAFGSNALVLTCACITIILEPAQPLFAALIPIGSFVGWAALALTATAAFRYAGPKERGHVLMFTGLLLGMLASITEGLNNPEKPWLAYHVLLAAWTGLGLVLVAAEPLSRLRDGDETPFSPFPHLASWVAFSPNHFRIWLHTVGLLVLLLALRSATTDPQRPYWSSGATLAVAVMAGATAVRSRSQAGVYYSGLLMPLACCLTWIAWNPLSEILIWPVAVYSLGYTLLLAFALASMIWSLIEFILRAGTPSVTLRGDEKMGTGSGHPNRKLEDASSQPVPVPIVSPPFQAALPAFAHVAAWLATILGGLLLVANFPGDLMFTGIPVNGLLPAGALAALTMAFIAFLWDADAPYALAGLYATGVLILGLGLQALALAPDRFIWTSSLALAAYVLMTALLGSLLPRLDELWRALRMKREPAWPEPWFLFSQALASVVVVGLSLWIVVTFDALNDRLIGSIALALLVPTAILLANGASGRIANKLRGATLSLAVLLAVELGWAALDPNTIAVKLHRHVLLLLALAVMTLVEGVILPRLIAGFGSWLTSARRAGPVLLAITMVVLIGLLGHEAAYFNAATKHTPLASWETATVGMALIGLIGSGICFAVAPATDPYELSEQRRPLYVYAAELLLLFLFVHVRLNVPELFGGALTKFWPLAIMAIAFIGIGLSEFFKRRGLSVLSQPLQRTGVFMPLLPLLAFWVQPPQAVHDFLVRSIPALQPPLEPLMKLHPNYGNYAIIWFALGLLYSWVASIKRSFRFALLAALAGNFGLWALLYNADLSFFTHPQVWMIPLALILLVSEHINRRELGRQKSNALRYLGLTMIYVSSTADMFLAWGENPYLPMVLAALSILGVFAGILLRVTAFLYLGTSFLFVVVFSMIWHAAVDGR